MERTQVLEMMGELKLYGMKGAYDEIYATALKRQHEPQHLVGDLLKAEISEKHARSIRYQLTIAKLPLAKDNRQMRGSPIGKHRQVPVDDEPKSNESRCRRHPQHNRFVPWGCNVGRGVRAHAASFLCSGIAATAASIMAATDAANF